MENVNAERNLDVSMVINVLTVLVDVVVTIHVLEIVIALTMNAVSILPKIILPQSNSIYYTTKYKETMVIMFRFIFASQNRNYDSGFDGLWISSNRR